MNDLPAFFDPDRLPPTISIALVLFFDVLLPLAAAVAAYVLASHHGQLAHAQEQIRDAEKPGNTPTVLRGVVQTIDADPEPVRVEITQNGFEWHSNYGWAHRWDESSRRIVARPFSVLLADQRSIRVEPGNSPKIFAPLDKTSTLGPEQRLRISSITDGTIVWIAGFLERTIDPSKPGTDYRTPAKSWTMVPSASLPLVISTEPLEDRFLRRAAWHRGWIVASLLLLLGLHAVLLRSFHVIAFRSTTIQATLHTPPALEEVPKRNDPPRRCVATLSWSVPLNPDVRVYEPIPISYCKSNIPAGTEVPVRVSYADAEVHQLGSRAQLRNIVAVLATLIPTLFVFLYAYATTQTRDWWERRVIENGEGRLGD